MKNLGDLMMVDKFLLGQYFPDQDALFSFSYTNPEVCDIEHIHEFDELVIVDKGCGVHVINGQLYFIQEGDVFWVKQLERHFYNELGTLKLMNILINTRRPFLYLQQIQDIMQQLYVSHQANFVWLMPKDKELCITLSQNMKVIYDKIKNSFTDKLAEFHLESMFMQILSIIMASQNHIHKNSTQYKIRNLLRYLQQNFSEPIDWQWLADKFYMSTKTMTRQVKELTGMSPVNYLNRLKVLAAREKIQQTDDLIIKIAGECGFENSDYFSKCYKKNFGISPSKERAKIIKVI